jgi:hypothetical protein
MAVKFVQILFHIAADTAESWVMTERCHWYSKVKPTKISLKLRSADDTTKSKLFGVFDTANWTHQMPNLIDSKLFRYWTYQITDFVNSDFIKYWTCQILNLFDAKLFITSMWGNTELPLTESAPEHSNKAWWSSEARMGRGNWGGPVPPVTLPQCVSGGVSGRHELGRGRD